MEILGFVALDYGGYSLLSRGDEIVSRWLHRRLSIKQLHGTRTLQGRNR